MDAADALPSKPTKAGFDGFVGTPLGAFVNFAASVNGPTATEPCCGWNSQKVPLPLSEAAGPSEFGV
jgi:hypothetical protein